MTVKELRDALPYNADDAEVLIAPRGCQYGSEYAAVSMLDGSGNNPRKYIIIVAAQPVTDEMNRIKEKRPVK